MLTLILGKFTYDFYVINILCVGEVLYLTIIILIILMIVII